eukprot:15127171-Alexandrium_andersonii.AAC.1
MHAITPPGQKPACAWSLRRKVSDTPMIFPEGGGGDADGHVPEPLPTPSSAICRILRVKYQPI